MKFTVLGASGFIGSALVRSLEGEGHEVFQPLRNDSSLFAEPLGCLLYCAGLTADFRSRPFDTVRSHVGLLADILERSDFEALVYLSSTRVYGGSKLGQEEAAISVRSHEASDLYTLSKLTGESLCFNGGRSGVRIARLPNVVGAGDRSTNFVPSLISEARRGSITLLSHPGSAKDYIALDDAVSTIAQIAMRGTKSIYNVASGKQITNGEIASVVAAAFGREVKVAEGAPLLTFPPISIERIQAEFAFSPTDVLSLLERSLRNDGQKYHGL